MQVQRAAVVISFLVCAFAHAQSGLQADRETREESVRMSKLGVAAASVGDGGLAAGGLGGGIVSQGVVEPDDVSIVFPMTPVNSTSTKPCYYNCFYRSGSPPEACDYTGRITLAKQVSAPFGAVNLRRTTVGSCNGTPVTLPVNLAAGEWLVQDFEFKPTSSGSFQSSHDYFVTPTNTPQSRFAWNLSGSTTTSSTNPCTPKALTPPATVQGRLTNASCFDTVIEAYSDLYRIRGVAGQTINVDYSSTEYDVFLWMEGIATQRISYLFQGVSRSRITHTFTETRDYVLEAEALYSPGTGSPYIGAYTLVVTTGTPPTTCSACVPNANTSCMLNDRFKVTMTWRDTSANLSGNGRLINYVDNRPVTDPANGEISESTFWSMYAHDPNSLEALVRMLRGYDTYWIFVTGFANAEYVVTVQDTRTCATWQRTVATGSTTMIKDFNAFPFP